MKKIDLHIHTVPAVGKDAHFEFDVTKFQEYIDLFLLDAVAITNHNLFDLVQFNEIRSVLQNVIIFPGIEIDLVNGQLLLIGGSDDLNDFYQKCQLVKKEVDRGDRVTIDKLEKIFVDLDKYLLIPHYDKRPKVDPSVISILREHIFAGEVQSPKKFNRTLKQPDSLTPVLFSDVRISTELDFDKCQGRQTFIQTNSSPLSISAIKAALRDRNKVFLSKRGNHGFFQIFNNGQELSTGLNVILGGRSSGKTFLLDRLESIFNTEKKNVKYIRQFDLVKEDEKKFNKILENEKSAIREEYLREFKLVVESVTDIDRRKTNHQLDKYLNTLLEFANNEKLHDEYSRAKLYTETPFPIRRDDELQELIKAVIILQENDTYSTIIDKLLQVGNLNKLLIELEKIYRRKTETKVKKMWINELILGISQKLRSRTSSPNIEHNDIDFFRIKIENESIIRFNAIVKALKTKRTILKNGSFGKFKIQAIAERYKGAGELHNESRKQISFTPAFKKYGSPILFLEELKEIGGLERTELYKYFCKVTYQVLNEYDKRISGGEQAEFNLLKALQDARQYEMLLVDEPESSFDNPFLKDSVNDVIKDISKELPVIVVTHNNTVGMLMQPDYILYTQRKIVDGNDEYYIFSGSPGDKEFRAADATETLSSHSIILDALEAGEDAYNIRKKLYDNFK